VYIVNPNIIDKCSYNVSFDIPFDIQNSSHSEVTKWCQEHIPRDHLWTINFCSGSSYAINSTSIASFEFTEDAALFKLTWG